MRIGTAVRIGLIGDRDDTVTAHRAIPAALALTGESLGTDVDYTWLPTDSLGSVADLPSLLAPFDALWCVPASPYRSTDGALRAIRHAREQGVPFLGTCGGFQHAVLEYARSVLGWADAAHAELDPDAERLVVAPLVCSLVEETGMVHFVAGSAMRTAYGESSALEGYHCRYGMSDVMRDALAGGRLTVTATDSDGDVRGIELADHPFFVASLFQPERAALAGSVPPLVSALLRSALRQSALRTAARNPA